MDIGKCERVWMAHTKPPNTHTRKHYKYYNDTCIIYMYMYNIHVHVCAMHMYMYVQLHVGGGCGIWQLVGVVIVRQVLLLLER